MVNSYLSLTHTRSLSLSPSLVEFNRLQGGAPLVLPSAPSSSSSSTSSATAAPRDGVEVYVRQMACRKPDCVPLETVVMLLGHGWHEKAEVLNAADAVTEAEVAAAAQSLWAGPPWTLWRTR